MFLKKPTISFFFNFVVIFIFVSFDCSAIAQSLSSHLYNQEYGLKNLDTNHLLETRSGAVLAATEDGLFVFDGHAFLQLGISEGLPEDGFFNDLILGPNQRTIVGSLDNRLVVAADPYPFSLQKLHFKSLQFPDSKRYIKTADLSVFLTGVAVSTGHHIEFLDLSDEKNPYFRSPPAEIDRANKRISKPSTLFGNKTALWVTDLDGQICVFSPDGDQCWKPNGRQRWGGFIALDDKAVMVRTGNMAVVLQLHQNIPKIEMLPDTNPGMASLSRYLRITRTPSGELVSQSRHGVVVRRNGQWKALRLTDGEAMTLSLEVDRSGSIWLGLGGEGVRQYFGVGAIENWNSLSGLSYGAAWSFHRSRSGTLWIGTNGGLNRVDHDGTPHQIFESRPVFLISEDTNGKLWLVIASSILEQLDPITGQKTEYPFQELSSVKTAPDGTIWIASGSGLYHLPDKPGMPNDPILASSATASFTNLTFDPDGTMWLTGSGMLWRKPPGGALLPIVKHWGPESVSTETLAHEPGGPVWVGTMAGLYRVDMTNGQVAVSKVPNENLPEHTISALAIDRPGHLWVGTSGGIAIYHDKSWITVDTSTGLVGNDINEDAIYEDTDGSIWVGTTQGASHIIKPDLLWKKSRLVPSFQSVKIDGKPYTGQTLAYGASQLDARLGILGSAHSTGDGFRYQIKGVTKGWQDVGSDHLIFPNLPSGKHVLQVLAFDPNTHVISAPIEMVISITRPWWEQPWTYGVAIILGGIGVWLAMRLRTRLLLRQSRVLSEEVQRRTLELEVAHRQLKDQARHDALTGLLNRGALQADMSRLLESTRTIALTVAIIDIDHFKKINDTYGHLYGDAVLVALGKRFRNLMQDGELVGRFGGEEYVLAVPLEDGEGTARIRSIIAHVTRDPVSYRGVTIKVTFSAGLAPACSHDTWDDIIGRADQALYRAKREGRNRVVANEPAS